MEMTGEGITFSFDPRDMLLSIDVVVCFVRIACSILEEISGFEPSSDTTDNSSNVFEACHCTQQLFFYLDHPRDAIDTFCHQFGLLSTDFHLILCADFVAIFNRASCCCSSSIRTSLLSANRR